MEQPQLEGHEQKKADEEESLNANITYEVIRRQGEHELERTSKTLAWSAVAAGLSMGFSLVAEGILHAGLPRAPWAVLISKLGYAFGFLIVILGSQQLYTENTLTPIVPLLSRKSKTRLADVLRLWGIVLLGNLVGAALFGLVLARVQFFEPHVSHAFLELSRESVLRDPLRIGISAIFAGWLIALMVWMLPAAETLQTIVIILMTWLVGVGGFAHSIAGAVSAFFVAFSGEAGLGTVLGAFLLPTIIGNTIGGVTLVAALNHAQVVE